MNVEICWELGLRSKVRADVMFFGKDITQHRSTSDNLGLYAGGGVIKFDTPFYCVQMGEWEYVLYT